MNDRLAGYLDVRTGFIIPKRCEQHGNSESGSERTTFSKVTMSLSKSGQA